MMLGHGYGFQSSVAFFEFQVFQDLLWIARTRILGLGLESGGLFLPVICDFEQIDDLF